jgi:hypothetical protein
MFSSKGVTQFKRRFLIWNQTECQIQRK